MKVFSSTGSESSALKEIDFASEREMQEFTEKNLAEVFDLEIIKSEFTIGKYRFDTLAFNQDTNSFVIIEYKNRENYSVIDQGFSYLATMLNNKAELVLEYNQLKGTNLAKDKINWEDSKLLFVAPTYGKYQKDAINFKDIAIELWVVKKFAYRKNHLISYFSINPTNTSASIKTVSSNKSTIDTVNKEIKAYNEEDLINKASTEIKELYELIKEKVLELGDIDLKINKQSIAFKGNKSIIDIIIYKQQLKIYLNLKSGELEDSSNKFKDIGTKGHWGNGCYECILKNKNDIDINYLMYLVKQSYKKNR